jgi:hypothetical protein
VFDRDGKRVGTLIELAGAKGEEIAIRHDALFLWRRRVLPLATVATVHSDQGAIVLNVDRRALKGTSGAPTHVEIEPPASTSAGDEDQDWEARIKRYISADVGDTDTETVAEDVRPTRGVGQPNGESRGGAQSPDGVHLQFVSTADGYKLLEQRGPAPAASDLVAVPEHDGVFRVAKLAGSPLPNDRRVCAYLERVD